MSPSCPISHRSIDANFVRLIALHVVIFSIMYILTEVAIFAYIILYDFIARGFRKNRFSPFATIAKKLLDVYNAKPRMTNEAPKRFALYLGIGMSALIVMLALFGYTVTSIWVTFVLFLCAFLEAAFDYCIGCKLYYALQLSKVIKHDRNFN